MDEAESTAVTNKRKQTSKQMNLDKFFVKLKRSKDCVPPEVPSANQPSTSNRKDEEAREEPLMDATSHDRSSTATTRSTASPASSESDKLISKSRNDKPAQPEIAFPKTANRKFNCSYYKNFPWIEYSTTEDAVYCFACRHFASNTVQSGELFGHVAFVDYGIRKWKDIHGLLRQHGTSYKHLNAFSLWQNYIKIQNQESNALSIASSLNVQRNQEIEENRRHVLFLLKATSFLGRQGLAFRGDDESSTSKNKGNFLELLETYADSETTAKLSSRYGHYTSHEYQNNLISVLADCTKDLILEDMSPNKFFSILVDETKDSSKKEQLSFLIRFVNCKGDIQERSLGCYHMKKLDATSLVESIFSVLQKHNLDTQKCVPQCYDGASVMSGDFNGVQQLVKRVVPHAVYIHCHSHRLKLCLVQTIKSIPEVEQFFSTLQTIYKFIMNSNTRYNLVVKAQEERNLHVIHLERLVETRWAYWYISVKKFLLTFGAILDVLEVMSTNVVDSDTRAVAVGLLQECKNEQFLTLLIIMEQVLSKIHSLSDELQNSKLVLSDAMLLIKSTRQSLLDMRLNEDTWDHVTGKVSELAMKNHVPLQKSTARSATLSKTLLDYYVSTTVGARKTAQDASTDFKTCVLFAVLDRFISELDRRFSENSDVLKAVSFIDTKSDNFLNLDCAKVLLREYSSIGINGILVDSQIQCAVNFLKTKGETFADIHIVRNMLAQLPEAFSEILKLIDLCLTLPVTTASNERFFSSLKFVKNYMRSSCGNDRLSDLLILCVEKDFVKRVDLAVAVDRFAKLKQRRYPLLY